MDINQINERLSPYYSLFIMIIFFGGLFITAYNFIISPSHLRIEVKTDQVSYPNSLYESQEEVRKYLSEESDKYDSLKYNLINISSFLQKTTEIKEIKLINTSSKTLHAVRFKYLNANNWTSYSVTSTYLTSNEEKELYSNLHLDEKRKIIYLKNTIDIPPKSEVIITLWGSFNENILNNNIIVTYSGGDGFIEESYTVSGIKGYFINNLFEFCLIILIIFSIVFYLGIKHVEKSSLNYQN